jgi:hypothetical protein
MKKKSDDVPKIIQHLHGKVFIFQFKLNSLNLTEERQGYLVRRAFIPNDKLEKDFLHRGNNGVIKSDEVPFVEKIDKELLHDELPTKKIEKEMLHDNIVS